MKYLYDIKRIIDNNSDSIDPLLTNNSSKTKIKIIKTHIARSGIPMVVGSGSVI